jgi:hypothetical protein
MLALRLALFAGFQSAVAGILSLTGEANPWAASAAWWPLSAVAANIVNLTMLAALVRGENGRLRDLYRPASLTWKKDLALAGLVTLAAAPLAALPNLGLAVWLFGDPQIALDLFVQPLPMWAAVTAVILFPVTTALAELPTYYAYVQPRLARLTTSPLLIVVVPALFHAIQHAALPMIFDLQFITWRALMFLPFALLLSFAIRRRPTLMPFLLVVHFLLDTQAAVMVLAVAH